MYTINSTNARSNWFGLLDSVVRGSEIVNISSKNGNAVLISQEEYNRLLETLYLYSIPNYRESVIEALKEPLEEGILLEEVNWDEL